MFLQTRCCRQHGRSKIYIVSVYEMVVSKLFGGESMKLGLLSHGYMYLLASVGWYQERDRVFVACPHKEGFF